MCDFRSSHPRLAVDWDDMADTHHSDGVPVCGDWGSANDARTGGVPAQHTYDGLQLLPRPAQRLHLL